MCRNSSSDEASKTDPGPVFVLLRVLQDLSSHVAKVLGSCGHFYAVEYLSAGHAWDQNIFSLDEVAIPGIQAKVNN